MELQKSDRLLSLDVFRGLTILIMVFVNDIASVKGLPLWLKHKEFHETGMTFVDVVFPAFLFIVGVSVPFAFAKYSSPLKLTVHVLVRTLGLLILGVLMVNIGSYSEGNFLTKNQWTLSVYVAAFLAWGTWSKKTSVNKVLNIIGFVGLGLCAWLYRGKYDGDTVWLQTQWWGILGLIGWAYFTVSMIYLLCKNNVTAIIGSIGILTAVYIGGVTGVLSFVPSIIADNVNLASHIGTHGLICTAGLYLGTLIFNGIGNANPNRFLIHNLLFGLLLLSAGHLISVQYPVSKTNATPSWGLMCAGYSALFFVTLYWFIDLKKNKKYCGFLVDAGQNPLLIYLLPGILYAIFGLADFHKYWSWGKSLNIGIVRSLVFTIFVLIIGIVLNRKKIRLKL